METPQTTARPQHPQSLVGDIDVAYETMPLPADPGLVLTIYSPEPASPSADAMALLATWAGTHFGEPAARISDDHAPHTDPT